MRLESPCSNQSACTFVSWLDLKCPLGWSIALLKFFENGKIVKNIFTSIQGWCGFLRVASLTLKGSTSACSHSGFQLIIHLSSNEVLWGDFLQKDTIIITLTTLTKKKKTRGGVRYRAPCGANNVGGNRQSNMWCTSEELQLAREN